MTEPLSWGGLIVSAVLAMTSIVTPAGAQTGAPANRALATRADLEALLTQARQGGAKLGDRDRQVLEHRLQDGDFLPGDRLVLVVNGEKALTDTFTVATGQVLQLPDMEPLQLHGVLRSELQPKLLAHISQYIREPSVQAEALIRIGILGSVIRPGYYNVRADQPLGDMMMLAGGLAPDANLGKSTILRSGSEFWPRDDVRRAMASGKSLDMMGIQGGDEIQIGRRGGGFGSTLTIITGVVTLTATIVLLTRN